MTSAGVASPCIDVCRMDPRSGLCEGCLRTIDEIAAWGTLDDGAKRAVWRRLELRRRANPPLPPPNDPSTTQASG